MLLNYLKLSLRLLVRNPFFSLINVIGLSGAFASFFILWDYSSSGLSSDRHHQDANRIYRLASQWHSKEGVTPMSSYPVVSIHDDSQ